MCLIEDSIRRLSEEPKYNLVLCLDECGTPATDRRFITGGVMVYENVKEVTIDWDRFWKQADFRHKKGRDLNREELLVVSQFLISQPIIPVAAWSILGQEDLDRLRKWAKKYERSNNPLKRFKKISGASWLWKYQMSQTLACAQATFMGYRGRIGRAAVYIDKINEEPEKRKHYQQLLTRHSKSSWANEAMKWMSVQDPIKNLILGSIPLEWQVEMNARGSLARMADICCTMFAQYNANTCPEPWDVIRIRNTVGETRIVAPCLGVDLTKNVQNWLEQLYSLQGPDHYP